jgi:hypothetical protein
MAKKQSEKDIIKSFKKRIENNYYSVEAINFFNGIKLKNKLIFELGGEGLSYVEISNRLGCNLKYVQENINSAYRYFLNPYSTSELYRLKVIRRSFKIMQDEIAKGLKKTLDAYSKFERGDINLEGKNAEDMIVEVVLKNVSESDIFIKIKNGEINKGNWELYFNQASLLEHLGAVGKIMTAKNDILRAMLFGVLKSYLISNLFLGRYLNSLISVSNASIFEDLDNLNISRIKKEVGKDTSEIGLISIANIISTSEKIRLNADFIKKSEEYLKFHYLRKYYFDTINYIVGIFKDGRDENTEVFKLLLFEPDAVSAQEIKKLNDLIDCYYKSLKKL